uniref:Uncharacterized protein n=2 Tax=Oryza punctata TaxID=4537 RepID=A0A0E0JMW1_ORYPU
MPKGAKKRAKLKKKQQGDHPAVSDDGGNNNNKNNAAENGSNDSSRRRDAASDGNHHLPSRPNIPHVDVSEDSMESSEEMVTPRAAASEADEEERKTATSEVPVEVVEAGEEVMVDALPPEAATAGVQEQQGKAEGNAEALVVVQEPEVKREESVAKVHPVYDPEPKGEEVLVVEAAAAASVVQEPEVKRDEVVVMETAAPPAVHEPEMKSGGVVVKDMVEVSRSLGAADTTEVARGPAVAVAAARQRATWWNCCGIFDAFSGWNLEAKKTVDAKLFKADGTVRNDSVSAAANAYRCKKATALSA